MLRRPVDGELAVQLLQEEPWPGVDGRQQGEERQQHCEVHGRLEAVWRRRLRDKSRPIREGAPLAGLACRVGPAPALSAGHPAPA
eukprot:7112900-Prymnesium_polylepis.1